jgi:uncharacterized protein
MKNIVSGRMMALPLMTIAFLLIYNPLTKFPYTFCVIILFILAATWLQDKSFKNLGFKKIGRREIMIILLSYLLLELSMDLIFQPLINTMFNEPADYSVFKKLEGNPVLYFKCIGQMWISAAIGEELLFRAFVFAQAKKLLGNRPFILILISAVLFSIPHLYQGNAGLLTTFVFGTAFAFLYHKFQNIWINIIVHGLIDTVFLTLAYYGLLHFYN